MCVPELLLPPVKKIGCLAEKRPYLPQNMLSLAHITYRPLAHLVPCWLVVVARGLYLARYLFTLYQLFQMKKIHQKPQGL